MANIKSAKKRVLTSEKSRLRNKAVRTNLRTAMKKAGLAAEENADNLAVVITDAVKRLDRAAGKGIIHRNKAARHKSQLQQKLNKVS